MVNTVSEVSDGFKFNIERNRGLGNLVESAGVFGFELIRKGEVIAKGIFNNASTVQGRNYVLDAAFRNSGTTSSWYIGLIAEDSFSALSSADTAASHGGWAEFEDYDPTSRPAWTKSAASSAAMLASAATAFTITAVDPSVFVKGAFIVSSATKGGGSGVLWSTGTFPADIPVQEDDVLNITYQTQLT